MPSQFEKRKSKEKDTATLVEEITEKREKAREKVELPETQEVSLGLTGYDIFFDESTRQYKVAVFKYDPASMTVKIERIASVSRQVALSYGNQKEALKTLIKG